MCFGGGGGGGGNAVEREKQRKAEQDKLIQQINKQFGVYTERDPYLIEQQYNDRLSRINYAADRAVQNEEADDAREYSKPQRQALEQWYEDAMEEFNKKQEQSRAAAMENKALRQQQYDDIRQSTIDYYSDDLNRQSEGAARQQKFAAARRGVIGGSSDLDQKDNLLEEYTRAALDIARRGKRAARRAKTADEQARLDLIGRVRQGLGGGVEAAQAALENSIEQAKQDAILTPLGQAFTLYSYYKNNQNTPSQQSPNRSGGSPSFQTGRPEYRGDVRTL